MKESIDRKTKLVFTDSNLSELQEAVIETFDVFHEILDVPCVNYNDLQDKLSHVDEGTWSTIRNKYLSDHKQRGADNDNVVLLLLDFVTTIDKCTRTLRNKLEERDSHVLQLEQNVKDLEGTVKHLQVSLQDKDQLLKTKTAVHAEMMSTNAGLSAKNSYMQKLLDEKYNKISDLERSNNVQLWEQEKKRALKESLERIEELESLLDDYKHGRESAVQKLRDMDNSHKKQMLREQLREKNENSSPDVTRLSRENYVQDKDILYLEKQLYDLQSHTVGFVGGMKTDFNKLCHKFVDKDNGGMDKEFVQLSSRMDNVCDAMAAGSVEKVRDVLPPHYKYYEQGQVKIRRIRRLSQANKDTTQPLVKPPVLKANETSPAKMPKIAEEKPANPIIVNPRTKKLHGINPVKYFPHMSQQFILEQFGRFREFDDNGDGVLDLTEVVKVVNQLGFTFNVHELQEAMEEVDRDGNHTLDFFEYLLIIDKLYRKTGKAQLFQYGIKEINKNVASKTCSIQ